MALLQEVERAGDTGIAKGIDSSAMSIILDLVQTYQYQYPIASTIREVVSNGVDSIKEKNMALSILSGEKQVSDFFADRTDGVYRDSQFNPDYYDMKYLSPLNKVEIEVERHNDVKDILRIKDYGVGLGGKRLEGVMQIGYSSKRNLKNALGKFGIGAKSPLSITSSYAMTSVYNGMEYKFMIYSDKVLSIVPQWDLVTLQENPSYTFSDGSVVYGALTEEYNSVTIEVETKHHQRSQVLDAIKTQLMYFEDIEFTQITEEGFRIPTPIRAEVIYEDDHLVISENSRYSKPHLILNNVNYGYIDFQELELEGKTGPIGIKMDPSEVEVNPSRESVIWSDKTREAVIRKFKMVQEIATNMVTKELSTETDYLAWSVKASKVLSRLEQSSGALGALSRIVDMSVVKPKFQDTDISWEFNHNRQFSGWRAHRLIPGKGRLAKREVISWELVDLEGENIYFQEAGDYNAAKDAYLFSVSEGPVFIINVPKDSEHWNLEKETLLRSSPLLKDYYMLEVPEDYKNEVDREVEVEEKIAEKANMSLAELRKLQGKIVVKYPQYYTNPYTNVLQSVTMTSIDYPINQIPTLETEEVYWGTAEDHALLKQTAALLFYLKVENKPRILQIARENLKYFKDLTTMKHIKEWYYRFKDGRLTTHPFLIGLNTALKMKSLQVENTKLLQIGFLHSFDNIDADLQTRYKEVCTFICAAIDRNTASKTHHYLPKYMMEGMLNPTAPNLDQDLEDFLQKLSLFQDIDPQMPDNERKALSLEYFGTPDVISATGYDKDMVDELTSILEEVSPYKTMVGSIDYFKYQNTPIPAELEKEVIDYIAYKEGR